MNDDLQTIAGHRICLEVSERTPLLTWADRHKPRIKALLRAQGALVIRGLRVHGTKQFGQFLELLFEHALGEYTYRSTPRTKLGSNVYTATEYHPSETIPQHNESAYANAWPMQLGFLCMVPPGPGLGGATPLADSRAVLARLPPALVDKFERRQLQYVRNYGSVDLPWSEVFQTSDRAQVEAFCAANDIAFEWTGDNGLRTRQITPATEIHPVTGDKVWFNQAHLFHVSGLPADVARDMLAVYRVEDLPRNVYFGDGAPIDVEDLDCIRAVYDELKFHFDWRQGDIVLLDNMLFTHGRQPYSGERKILVGMAEMRSRSRTESGAHS